MFDVDVLTYWSAKYLKNDESAKAFADAVARLHESVESIRAPDFTTLVTSPSPPGDFDPMAAKSTAFRSTNGREPTIAELILSQRLGSVDVGQERRDPDCKVSSQPKTGTPLDREPPPEPAFFGVSLANSTSTDTSNPDTKQNSPQPPIQAFPPVQDPFETREQRRAIVIRAKEGFGTQDALAASIGLPYTTLWTWIRYRNERFAKHIISTKTTKIETNLRNFLRTERPVRPI